MPSLLKDLQQGFTNFGRAFKTIWINPGYCRWINRPPLVVAKHYTTIDLFKVKTKDLSRKRKRQVYRARGKAIVIGTLTLPVGVAVALVTLPVLFFYKGLPHLRKEHLDKVEEMMKKSPARFCARNCARIAAKVFTGIGTPRFEELCEGCRGKIEGAAREAAELVHERQVQTNDEVIEELLETNDDGSDQGSDESE